MLNLEMSYANGCAVISASGALATADDVDTVVAALMFVPADDHVILDLSGIVVLTSRCGQVLIRALSERIASAAEVVVVIDRPEVTMRLIVHNVDRVAPMATSMHQAVQIIRARAGYDVMEVA